MWTTQNLLQRWAQNEDSFPRLAKLCKCYLSVPPPAHQARGSFLWLEIPSRISSESSSSLRWCPCDQRTKTVTAALWRWIGSQTFAVCLFGRCIERCNCWFTACLWALFCIISVHKLPGVSEYTLLQTIPCCEVFYGGKIWMTSSVTSWHRLDFHHISVNYACNP